MDKKGKYGYKEATIELTRSCLYISEEEMTDDEVYGLAQQIVENHEKIDKLSPQIMDRKEIDALIKKAGLEEVVSVYNSAIEINVHLTKDLPLPGDNSGYGVIAKLIETALTAEDDEFSQRKADKIIDKIGDAIGQIRTRKQFNKFAGELGQFINSLVYEPTSLTAEDKYTEYDIQLETDNQIALRKIEEKFISKNFPDRVNLSEMRQWNLLEYYHWLQQKE